MALPTEELKRRIDAARTLRGLKQLELAALLEADGLGKHDVGRLERGELDLRRVHLDALQRHLQMPEWWFTAEEIALPDDQPALLLDRVEAMIDSVDALVNQHVGEEIAQAVESASEAQPGTPGRRAQKPRATRRTGGAA